MMQMQMKGDAAIFNEIPVFPKKYDEQYALIIFLAGQ